MPVTLDQLNQAHNIMAECEEKIFLETGLKIRLNMSKATLQVLRPDELLVVVAHSLGMKVEDYSKHSKKNNVVTLRFLASLFIKKYWPKFPTKEIGLMFGGQDHTTVLNALKMGANLLENGDQQFTSKYNIVQDAVNNWIKNYEKADN